MEKETAKTEAFENEELKKFWNPAAKILEAIVKFLVQFKTKYLTTSEKKIKNKNRSIKVLMKGKRKMKMKRNRIRTKGNHLPKKMMIN